MPMGTNEDRSGGKSSRGGVMESNRDGYIVDGCG